MCFLGDLEPCEVWHEEERTARKGHRCDCCRGVISPGQTYLTHFSVFERQVTTDRMCLPCRDDRGAFAAAHDGTLPTPGYFPRMLAGCVSENDPDDRRWLPMLERIRASRAAGSG